MGGAVVENRRRCKFSRVRPTRKTTADEGGGGEWVFKGVGVDEGESPATNEGVAVVNEAVVGTEAAEDFRVDEVGGAELAAAEVDVGDAAVGRAHVSDLHRVGGYAVGKWRRRALAHLYVGF
ncbi:hypothetical protein U1Q18_027171 [Sarracenia purpurea var. burkii]